MNATRFAAPRLFVPAIVTAIVAAWFVLASGAALAEVVPPGAVASTPTQITLTPQGTMKLVVVAVRPAAPAQVTMTREGAMKLTVAAQRPPDGDVRTAATRQASHS